MSNNDFDKKIREVDLIIKPDGKEHMLTCTMIEFIDKLIINLSLDGETDISYDIQIPEMNDLKKPLRRYDFDVDGEEVNEEDDDISSTVTPTVLIGAGDNLKMQVLASQIGNVMSRLVTKNIILNISGKLFGRSSIDEYRPGDSVLVQQCTHLVQQTYQ